MKEGDWCRKNLENILLKISHLSEQPVAGCSDYGTLHGSHEIIIDDLTLHVRNAVVNVELASRWFERLCSEPFQDLIPRRSPESTRKVSSVVDYCSEIADRLGISFIDLDSETTTFRKIHIIPHIKPIMFIAASNGGRLTVCYGKDQENIQLEVLLRFAHANIPLDDVQTIHFLTKSLLDLHTQVTSRHLCPDFNIHDFTCNEALWIEYDIFGPIFKMRSEPLPQLPDMMIKWANREISNYEYLDFLNRVAGRVRGQIHNHPMFPWVVDFSHECGGWRALNRTKYRLVKGDAQLRETYSREPRHHVPELLTDIGFMSYRARIETRENLCKHVRKKWVPEEYPSTMARMYAWTPDECIPEFYDDLTIFKSHHVDMQDIELPTFAATPEKFIYWHRKMLESDRVSEQLHRWIDLVFGVALDGDEAEKSLNVHLCYVEDLPEVRTHGIVKLFDRPHPQRKLVNDTAKGGDIHLEEVSRQYGWKNSEEIKEEHKKEESNLTSVYRKVLDLKKSCNASHISTMVSLMRIVEEVACCHVLKSWNSDEEKSLLRKAHGYRIPLNYRNLLDLFDNPDHLPDPTELEFIASVILNIPDELNQFYYEFSRFSSYNALRNMVIVEKNSNRSQSIIVHEVESLKRSVQLSRNCERCVIAAFQELLEDDEASVQAVHKLMPAIARCFKEESLQKLVRPLVSLIKADTSVKLLDRRFLLTVSICYGTSMFLDQFLPPIVEALASWNEDRSIVAKESIMWLSKRYGPVITAKFISSNLLRIMASIYEGYEDDFTDEELKVIQDTLRQTQLKNTVFNIPLNGEYYAARLETTLTEIVAMYSITFITVQYIPFCVDVIEQYQKRPSAQLEPAILSTFRVVQLSVRAMTDTQLLNYLEENIIDKILYRVLSTFLKASTNVTTERVRLLVICKAISLLYYIAQRIGAENSRLYAQEPFKLLFETFCRTYETEDGVNVVMRKDHEWEKDMFIVPVWMVQRTVEKLASEWGVPLLSTFCPTPAFLVPFVSNSSTSTPSVSLQQALTIRAMSSGNRLFSMSGSGPSSSSLTGFGTSGSGFDFSLSFSRFESTETGTLSSVWCARVTAAVCGMRSALRFDHLTLCKFNGHNGAIKKLAAISNENSFVSASSDKTVKLWSVKPEREEVECQWTYTAHSRPINDISILADNSIASTDGILHVWDPFRAVVLSQLPWDSEGNIVSLQKVDRHTIAVISSLHSTVKLFDTRTGNWVTEMKLTPSSGVTRALACRDSGTKMSVAMSNGTLVVLDGRIGKVVSMAHGNSSHINFMEWLNSTECLVCDADEPALVMEVKPRLKVVRRLSDTVNAAASADGGLLATIQTNNTLRVYTDDKLQLESRLKTEELKGVPTSVLPLPLNSTYLIGGSSGVIKMMC